MHQQFVAKITKERKTNEYMLRNCLTELPLVFQSKKVSSLAVPFI
jgi:hypothetical protein